MSPQDGGNRAGTAQSEAAADILLPTSRERRALWHQVAAQCETFLEGVDKLRVAPVLDREALRAVLDQFPFDRPRSAAPVLHEFMQALERHQVHTPHPCYFGLFNPAPAFLGIMGDVIAATYNPQLAAWSHSPLAAETEHRLILEFAKKFGYDAGQADGCFTSGGAEANETALVCALARRWPGFLEDGLRALPRQPVLYASRESHHSIGKAASAAGLGRRSVRMVPVDADLRLHPAALRTLLHADRAAGCEPFLIVATAGTTGAGAIDPLLEIATIARDERAWLHVDAAWGGAAALVPELRGELDGIAQADSITFDAHKFLSVPMGAGMFLTRHADALGQAFAISTAYMPKEGERLAAVDPYTHTPQWSRRFIGLKLFLTLATAGWDGYASVIRQQTAMGDLLRQRLIETGWRVVNRTRLPLVCFTRAGVEWDGAQHQRVAERVIASGRAWISTIVLDETTPALRACITNYRTGPEHIETLVEALAEACF